MIPLYWYWPHVAVQFWQNFKGQRFILSYAHFFGCQVFLFQFIFRLDFWESVRLKHNTNYYSLRQCVYWKEISIEKDNKIKSDVFLRHYGSSFWYAYSPGNTCCSWSQTRISSCRNKSKCTSIQNIL